MDNKELKARFHALLKEYKEQGSADNFSALLLGNAGSGKTCSLATAVKPVVVDSFDPGGTKVLGREIERGEVLPRRYEDDDFKHPTAYAAWEKQFLADVQSGFFDSIGTYAIDSLTTMVQAMLAATVARTGTGAKNQYVPSPREYLIVAMTLRDVIKKMSKCKCSFICIGHMELDKDELTGEILAGLKGFRSLKVEIPLLFDERYIMETRVRDGVYDAKFKTQSTGRYQASSRLAALHPALKATEPADWKAILKKVGRPHEDLTYES